MGEIAMNHADKTFTALLADEAKHRTGNTAQMLSRAAQIIEEQAGEIKRLSAQQPSVVLPSKQSVMRIVLREMGSSHHMRGTSNWCADVGVAVLNEVRRLMLSAGVADEQAAPSAASCCTPTEQELELLKSGEYRPEELWGASVPSCPNCAPKPAADVVPVPRELLGLPAVGSLCEARIPHHTRSGRQMLWTEVEVIAHAIIQGVIYSWVKEPGESGGFYAPMMLSFRALLNGVRS
jgi:hypothetical protein